MHVHTHRHTYKNYLLLQTLHIYILIRTGVGRGKGQNSKRSLWRNKFDCFLPCRQRLFLLWKGLTEMVSYEMRGLDWWYRRSFPILCIHLWKKKSLSRIFLAHRRSCQPGRSSSEEGVWNLGSAAPWRTKVLRGNLRLALAWVEVKFINNLLKCCESGPSDYFFLDLLT